MHESLRALAEYFAEETVEVPYRGHDGALFRRDYGRIFRELFPSFIETSAGSSARTTVGTTSPGGCSSGPDPRNPRATKPGGRRSRHLHARLERDAPDPGHDDSGDQDTGDDPRREEHSARREYEGDADSERGGAERPELAARIHTTFVTRRAASRDVAPATA